MTPEQAHALGLHPKDEMDDQCAICEMRHRFDSLLEELEVIRHCFITSVDDVMETLISQADERDELIKRLQVLLSKRTTALSANLLVPGEGFITCRACHAVWDHDGDEIHKYDCILYEETPKALEIDIGE